MKHLYILTGPPGSGKSLILDELSKQGYEVICEPARAILAEQRLINGEGVYDKNPFLFKELMLSRTLNDYENARRKEDVVFFDRGIPDIIAYSKCFGLNIGAERRAADIHRYNPAVFFTPAWEDIYINDEERKLSFEQTKDFENDLKGIYRELNYRIINVPLTRVPERVNFILEQL